MFNVSLSLGYKTDMDSSNTGIEAIDVPLFAPTLRATQYVGHLLHLTITGISNLILIQISLVRKMVMIIFIRIDFRFRDHMTVPQKGLDDRPWPYAMGKMLGGSSSISQL
jgi:hypothetical protein